MKPPLELQLDQPLTWSTGTGVQVWRMFCHCLAGDVGNVRTLLDAQPELIECSYAYRTPLYFAVRENQLGVARFLLERGANPVGLAVNDSLLQITRDRGYREMEQLLDQLIHGKGLPSDAGEQLARIIREHDVAALSRELDEHPEWIRARDDRSNEPIHWATMTRQPEMIDLLLERGADIESQRLDGARPMQLFHGDYHFRGWDRVPRDWPHSPRDILSHLLKRGAFLDLCTACHLGDEPRVRALIAEDPAAVNRLSDCRSYYLGSGAPIFNAAGSGHLNIVCLLLAHGADPNLPEPGIAPHGHALYEAIAKGHHEIAELLIEAGAYVNPSVESSADALSRALSNGDERSVRLLCKHGAARDVHLLAYDGDLRTAAAVFAADPKRADDPEALANAAGEGQDDFVHLMLRYCPDLPKRLEFPGWLVAAKNAETNRLLFRHGMDPNRADWLGVTPLHHIARRGDLELARLFLEHGARLDLRDDDICSTPIAWAAKFGQLELVQYFLSIGAPPQSDADPPWARPIEWAKRRGHEEVADFLRSHGARESTNCP